MYPAGLLSQRNLNYEDEWFRSCALTFIIKVSSSLDLPLMSYMTLIHFVRYLAQCLVLNTPYREGNIY